MKHFAVILFVVMVASSATAADLGPPRGLYWGMSWYDMEAKFANDSIPKGTRLKLKTREQHESVPASWRVAEVENMTIFGQEVDEARVVFDSLGGLCGVIELIAFSSSEHARNPFSRPWHGKNKAWEYQQKLLKAMIEKYGPPTEDQSKGVNVGTGIAFEAYYRTLWSDGVDTKISLLITRTTRTNILATGEWYVVRLDYANKEFVQRVGKQEIYTDEI